MFNENYDHQVNNDLIDEALKGNKTSLEKLIKKHQDYIWNISLKLFLDPDDALDATQEVLIKIITHLKTFKKESHFRTWIYRVALNHFINTPKRKMEKFIGEGTKTLDGFSDEPVDNLYNEAEVEEVRILCSTAMLMCLNREQRLLYIIGEIFGADHNVGAEIFEISTANYRVKLHRAKIDLLTFVSGKCGLVNPQNPCRCPKKTKIFIENGIVDKQNLRFNNHFKKRIKDIVITKKNQFSDEIQLNLVTLFKDSPFQIKTQIDQMLLEIVK